MKQRIQLQQAAPDAFKAMLQFDGYLQKTRIPIIQLELIRMRASQINQCTYCLDKHAQNARSHGETEQRLYTLSSWRETPFFSEEEQAILALTESMTLIHQQVSDEVYQHAVSVLGESYTAEIMMAIIIINAWNRIGVTTRLQPSR